MKVLLAAGGTGGHVFPALSVARFLQQEHHTPVFVTNASAKEHIRNTGFETFIIDVSGMAYKPLWQKAVGAARLVKAFFRSAALIKTVRPDVVVGFGGYTSAAVVTAAVACRIPAMIHEQNVIPGWANRYLGRIVRKVAVSFQQTARYFPAAKVVLTGCPMRMRSLNLDREKLLEKYRLQEHVPVLLVLGGSQGSEAINNNFIEAAGLIIRQAPFQVIHITGQKDTGYWTGQYQAMGIRCAVFSFLEPVEEAYALADLVICRAGALTVFEVAKFALPAIVIPYPHAGGHQAVNAKMLEQAGLAVVIEQVKLNPDRLAGTIVRKLKENKTQPAGQKTKKESVDFLVSDAVCRLAEQILILA